MSAHAWPSALGSYLLPHGQVAKHSESRPRSYRLPRQRRGGLIISLYIELVPGCLVTVASPGPLHPLRRPVPSGILGFRGVTI